MCIKVHNSRLTIHDEEIVLACACCYTLEEASQAFAVAMLSHTAKGIRSSNNMDVVLERS